MAAGRSTLQKVKRLVNDQIINEDGAIDRIISRLWRMRVAVKGNSIFLSNVEFPLGNKAWGMVEYLQRNQYHLADFHQYQNKIFGEDGNNFYSYKRKAA